MEATDVPHVSNNIYVGLGLAMSSSLFIGSSFVIKKKGLLKLSVQGQIRAGLGGYGYLKEWVWWLGFLSMGLGEVVNFAAYAFAPASLVTPLGVLSVLVGTFLSSVYLGERLNLLGKIGCFLCIIGSTLVVLHSPKEEIVDNMEQLGQLMVRPGFITYIVVVILVTAFLIICLVPRCGNSNVTIYVLICSMIGSLSVVECKGLGLALRETFGESLNQFTNWLTWFLLISLVICITIQMNYLNKALDIFNTSVVTPIYYVFFTTFVLCASSILFQEWQNMAINDIVGSMCGFLTVICGIFLLNVFREWDISFNNLNNLLQKKEILNSHVEGDQKTSIVIDCHSQRNGEKSNLLERHSRQSSLEARMFQSVGASDGQYNVI